MPNEISWFHSGETGAPVLNNAAGSLDAVLHACLVTGFNTQTVTSVVVSSGVATVTKSGHGYADRMMVDHSGATPSGLNGRAQITVTGSGTYTFPAPGVADGTATGTITAKRSPLGWVRSTTSGNVSIYERTDVTATTMALRVDDSGTGAASATHARIRMLETWTDINTFTNPAPAASAYSGQGFWLGKGVSSTTAKPWLIVGDSRRFYVLADNEFYPGATYGDTYYGGGFFGDFLSDRAGDAYRCLINGQSGTGTSVSALFTGGSVNSQSQVDLWLARAHHGIGAPINAWPVSVQHGYSGASGSVYPNPVNNGLRLSAPVLVAEVNGGLANPIRGALPGMAHVLQRVPATALHLKIHDSIIGSDRAWLTVGLRQSSNIDGCVAFDITGPW